MKITINQALIMDDVLKQLAITCESFKISYWITKNMKALVDILDFYNQKRNEIFNQYLLKDDKGKIIVLDDNKFKLKDTSQKGIDKFNNIFNELLNTECDIEPYFISLSTLENSNIKMTVEQVRIIDCLINDKE